MKNIKMLVADDEAVVRDFIRSIIEKERLPVSTLLEADNGLEAVRLAGDETPDLILLDIRMPEMGGLEACRAILEKRPESEVIIISAYDEFDYAKTAFKAGVKDYLLKPVRSQQITDLINSAAKNQGQEPSETDSPPLVKAVTRYVEDHLEQSIGLTDIAKAVFISPYHLSRKFKRLTGQSLTAFIQEKRLAKAEELLAATGLSITEVAGLAGFNNSCYFATCFKAKNGRTPLQFRRQSNSRG